MPYDDPDETDPMALRAIAMPAEPGDLERMAEAVVDEYVRFGFTEDQLLGMFRDPFFAMTHGVWKAMGDAWCEKLVREVSARWRRA